jgi:hypothetical protein
MSDRDSKVTLTDGRPVYDGHRELKENGQQRDYVVLSAEERAKGFVRPVRRTYVHRPPAAPTNLRDITEEEAARFEAGKYGYAKFEPYPPERGIGRFWTQAELDRLARGCGAATTMSQSIAEAYARDPKFYGGTFCVGCGKHYPVGENGEFVWDDGTKVGT